MDVVEDRSPVVKRVDAPIKSLEAFRHPLKTFSELSRVHLKKKHDEARWKKKPAD